MKRHYWSDTLEPMLGEGVEADEDIQQLGRKLGRLAAEGGAMPLVEMDGFVAGLLVLSTAVSASEWLPPVWGAGTVFDGMKESEKLGPVNTNAVHR